MMKSLTIVISCILILCAVIASAYNVTWGVVGPYDRLVARDFVIKDAKWFGKHQEIIQFPPKNHVSFVTLSAIRVWDFGGRKDFGYATLVKGGPRYRNATIEIRSQSGKRLNFTLEYYAH